MNTQSNLTFKKLGLHNGFKILVLVDDLHFEIQVYNRGAELTGRFRGEAWDLDRGLQNIITYYEGE